jgi:GNAT superfamily N-acetyltransferase
MRIQLDLATAADVLPLVELRAAVAEKLTARYGKGPWSHASTEKGARFELRTSRVFVARAGGRLIATLRLATKKPWAIDTSYFSACRRPLYLLSMAVAPDLQQQGIGRRCVEEIKAIGSALARGCHSPRCVRRRGWCRTILREMWFQRGRAEDLSRLPVDLLRDASVSSRWPIRGASAGPPGSQIAADRAIIRR